MTAGALPPGAVVRIPKGSRIADNYTQLALKPRKARKDWIGVVDYTNEGEVGFTGAKGPMQIAHREDAELVTADRHTLIVTRKALGGYPIAGWNWPMYGYDYDCSCGESLADRDDYAIHLQDLVEGEAQA